MSALYDFAEKFVNKVTEHSTDSLLNKCNLKTPKLSYDGHTVRAKCVKVYDGDTATFVFIPPGMKQPYKFSCRCLGYNSAEIKTKNIKEKEKAEAARDYLSNMILNKIVTLRLGKHDKYGRVLVDMYLDGLHINKHMIEKGHGVYYDGTGPKLY